MQLPAATQEVLDTKLQDISKVAKDLIKLSFDREPQKLAAFQAVDQRYKDTDVLINEIIEVYKKYNKTFDHIVSFVESTANHIYQNINRPDFTFNLEALTAANSPYIPNIIMQSSLLQEENNTKETSTAVKDEFDIKAFLHKSFLAEQLFAKKIFFKKDVNTISLEYENSFDKYLKHLAHAIENNNQDRNLAEIVAQQAVTIAKLQQQNEQLQKDKERIERELHTLQIKNLENEIARLKKGQVSNRSQSPTDQYSVLKLNPNSK